MFRTSGTVDGMLLIYLTERLNLSGHNHEAPDARFLHILAKNNGICIRIHLNGKTAHATYSCVFPKAIRVKYKMCQVRHFLFV